MKLPNKMWQIFASWGSTVVDEKNLREIRAELHRCRDSIRSLPDQYMGWEMVRFTDVLGCEHEVQTSSISGYCETSVELKRATREFNDYLRDIPPEKMPWEKDE